MEDDVERSPGREIEEPHRVALQGTQPRLGEQEEREDHGEHREEHDCQHDVEDRHPRHRLLSDRIVRVARLNVGASLREGVDSGGAAATRHRVARLHEGVDRGVLAHDAGEVVPRPCEGLVHDRDVVFQLRGRDGVAELRIDLLRPRLGVGLDHRRPLPVERLIGLPAGDDIVLDGAVPLSLQPFLRARLRPRPDSGPQVGRLSEVGERLLVEHHVAE